MLTHSTTWPISKENRASLKTPHSSISKLWRCSLSLPRLIATWPRCYSSKVKSLSVVIALDTELAGSNPDRGKMFLQQTKKNPPLREYVTNTNRWRRLLKKFFITFFRLSNLYVFIQSPPSSSFRTSIPPRFFSPLLWHTFFSIFSLVSFLLYLLQLSLSLLS